MSLQFELQTDSADVRPYGVPTPLVKVCSAWALNANNCRASGTVIVRSHKGAGKQSLPLQTHSRLRQLFIGCRSIIAQEREQGHCVGHLQERRFHSTLGGLNLG